MDGALLIPVHTCKYTNGENRQGRRKTKPETSDSKCGAAIKDVMEHQG